MEILSVLALIFAAGFGVMMVSRKIGIPAIPALIITGIGLSQLIDPSEVADLMILGVTFLIFYVGLRTDLDGFREVSSDSLNVALIQVLVVFPIGFFLGNFVGLDLINSLYLALAASLASTLAGTDIFDRELRMDLHHGQISTGSNFVHDLAAVIIISALAVGLAVQGFQTGLLAGLVLLSAFVFREVLSKKIHSFLQREELRVVFMLAVYASAVGLAELTELSVILLTFSAGLMFSRGSETEEFLDVLEPLKDFFSVILFVGIGSMVLTPSIQVLNLVLVLLGLVLILRPLITSLLMLVDGHGGRKSFKTSVSMVQLSEFALAAVLIAWVQGVVSTTVFEAVVIATAVSMILSSLGSKNSDLIYERVGLPFRLMEELLEYDVKNVEMSDHVVVVGFDLRGQKVAEVLEEEGREFVVVDYNSENVKMADREGYSNIFGDIQEPKVLEAAKIEQAETVVVTSDHRPVIDKMLELEGQKRIVIGEREMRQEFKDKDVTVLIESEMEEEALKHRISELLDSKE